MTMSKIFSKLLVNILLMTMLLILVEGKSPGIATEGNLCYPTEQTKCYSPDYFVHWSGMKCKYGARPENRQNMMSECWPWFYWYMEVVYVLVGVPVVVTLLGILLGPLCGSDSGTGGAYGCLTGCTLTWPCCAIPFLIWFYSTKIRCELCQEKLKSHNCQGNEALSHREECVEKNGSKYNTIPNSPKYTCKKCETNLKLWPRELLPKSTCVKCLLKGDIVKDPDDSDIVNNGSNLHVCFTCAGTGSYTRHHLCSRHARQGTTTQVDWENLDNLMDIGSPEYFQTQNYEGEGRPLIQGQPSESTLPPGWKVVTNPVTGEPYGLCDPTGKIKPLVDNLAIERDGIPPSYEEAVPSTSSRYSWNEKLNKGATNLKNKSQIMARQTSIEMEAAARRFRQ